MMRVLDVFAHLASNGLIPSLPNASLSSTPTDDLASATSNHVSIARYNILDS